MAELYLPKDKIVVSKTDIHGKITYGNRIFIELTGWQLHELIGAPHNIIRHEAMPKAVFKLLWENIRKGIEVNAFVLNKAKNGDHYWVFANVTPDFDKERNIIGYHSIRRHPRESAIKHIVPIYKAMLDAEKRGGVDASTGLLVETLCKLGLGYEELIFSLQFEDPETRKG